MASGCEAPVILNFDTRRGFVANLKAQLLDFQKKALVHTV